jgi:murein DD-endopeptidase MepM/ murein hydrolase activator NlpD
VGTQLRTLTLTVAVLTGLFAAGCSHLSRHNEPAAANASAMAATEGQSPTASKITPAWMVERGVASIPDKQAQRRNKLMWPIARHTRISQQFNPDAPHDGIDIPAPRGTRIYAPAPGRVAYAGHKFHGYGKMILIEHNDRLATIYGHCQKLFVHNGDQVQRGTLIGLVGNSGRSTAPHLHFEVRVDRQPVNPLVFLP